MFKHDLNDSQGLSAVLIIVSRHTIKSNHEVACFFHSVILKNIITIVGNF